MSVPAVATDRRYKLSVTHHHHAVHAGQVVRREAADEGIFAGLGRGLELELVALLGPEQLGCGIMTLLASAAGT